MMMFHRSLLALCILLAGAASGQDAPKKDAAFENSLGMKFVPVAIHGAKDKTKTVFFSVWETRVKDYRVYAKANPKVDDAWQPEDLKTEDHPVVNVNALDAAAFCKWLTEKERAAKKIGPKDVYRLPTDHEWSCAAGIGGQEDPAKPPMSKTPGVLAEDHPLKKAYPWGKDEEPPADAGNFDLPLDPFEKTSPVGRFQPSKSGLHDLFGNVAEWCSDVIREKGFGGEMVSQVTRGGSWWAEPFPMASRMTHVQDTALHFNGFRCVLEKVP